MTSKPALPDPLARRTLSVQELQQVLAAERRDGVFFAWRDHDGTFQVRCLDDDDDGAQRVWTIGRRPGMDLVVDDPKVSGLHARLQRDAGEWTVTDPGSKNGIFVNDERVVTRRLADSDRIRVGDTIVAFNGKPPPIPPTARDASAPPIRYEPPTPSQRRVLVALCRPLLEEERARQPATNRQIAGELDLTVGAVKAHLRHLCDGFGLAHLGQNDKRVRLAADAVEFGVVGPRDLSADL